MPELLARLLIFLASLVVRVHVYSLAKLMGYRRYEPERDTILVTCCTNGLGHVHQLERVLTVLQGAGLEFPVIALAKEQKVPKYKLDSLKAAFPHATFYNLNFEVDYDSGKVRPPLRSRRAARARGPGPRPPHSPRARRADSRTRRASTTCTSQGRRPRW